LEMQFFAYVHMRGLRTVRRGDLAALRMTADQERKLLSRLARASLIARVSRGLYLVPPRLPLGGRWTPDESMVLTALLGERKGRYQICGPNAFNRYGFDPQIPARLYVYNDRLSAQRVVGVVGLNLIKVARARLGDVEWSKAHSGLRVPYSSRARTLVDATYDWSRFNSLPRAYQWIRTELKARRVAPAELVRLTLRYGDIGTVRRIGALLHREGVDPPLLRKLDRVLTRTSSLIPWDPTRPKRGTVDRRWGVVWNA
jgi:predicted transcriptional regulator of viral defense system